MWSQSGIDNLAVRCKADGSEAPVPLCNNQCAPACGMTQQHTLIPCNVNVVSSNSQCSTHRIATELCLRSHKLTRGGSRKQRHSTLRIRSFRLYPIRQRSLALFCLPPMECLLPHAV